MKFKEKIFYKSSGYLIFVKNISCNKEITANSKFKKKTENTVTLS